MRMNPHKSVIVAASFDINAQRGSALITGLVFLVAIMMLGLSASSSSIQQEMGMRNIRDQALALEAADAALRAGETWLRTNSGPLTMDYGPRHGSAVVQPEGFCAPTNKNCAEAGAAFWEGNGRSLGKKGVDPTPMLSLVADQPSYIIELLLCPSKACAEPPHAQTRYYRITARGVGLSAKTEHIVQSVYRYN